MISIKTREKKFIVGNWKMNQNIQDITKFFAQFGQNFSSIDLQKVEAWIAPQYIHIPYAKSLASPLGPIKIGAQNCSFQKSGALTGEVSPDSLQDLGADFVILGHSERRAHFGETSESLQFKVLAALEAHLNVIYCIGETESERTSGKAFSIVEEQLVKGLQRISPNLAPNIFLAYEPVWAIGTGKAASPQDAQEMHSFIIRILKEQLNWDSAVIPPILYGGSVKPENILLFLEQPDIQGALIGGASLKGDDFNKMCLLASA